MTRRSMRREQEAGHPFVYVIQLSSYTYSRRREGDSRVLGSWEVVGQSVLRLCAKSLNSNGSWWIVQIPPTERAQRSKRKKEAGRFFRSDLNYPPTAVGGIKTVRSY